AGLPRCRRCERRRSHRRQRSGDDALGALPRTGFDRAALSEPRIRHDPRRFGDLLLGRALALAARARFPFRPELPSIPRGSGRVLFSAEALLAFPLAEILAHRADVEPELREPRIKVRALDLETLEHRRDIPSGRPKKPLEVSA